MEQIRRVRFSPKEVANQLGISKSKLYEHMKRGEIGRGIIVNKRRWFSPRDVELFIEHQTELAREQSLGCDYYSHESDEFGNPLPINATED